MTARISTIHEHALEMLESGSSPYDVLCYLTSECEKVSGPGTAASILLVDDDGLLRNGASPNLPEDYIIAIDGIKPDPNLGTCAAAAATGKMVITPDFTTDSKWAELKHLPRAIGFHGAWSMPIMDGNRVLGTFGTYYPDNRKPSPEEVALVKDLASVAASVLKASARKK